MDVLFPQWCVGCSKEGELIYYSCRRSLPQILSPLCPRCGRPQPSGIHCPGCMGRLVDLSVVDNCLIQWRHAPPPARTPTVDKRQSNVAGAFTCSDHMLPDKQVLLVDDVFISGATLDACAAALKAIGATSVWGLVLAREI
ncbi:ComF family protein [Chloroflexota bacterium]